MMIIPTWTPILFHIFLGGHHRRLIPYDINGPFKQAMMSLFRLAWSSKVQLPLLITVCFMAFDIRLQIEINIFWDQANHRRRGEEEADGDGDRPGRVLPVGVAPLALAEQALLGIDTSDEDEGEDEEDEDESDTDTDTDEDEDKDKNKKDKKKDDDDDDDDDKGGKGKPGESSGRSNPSSSAGQGDGAAGSAPGPRDRDRDNDDEGRDLSLVLQVELHHGHGARYSDSVNVPPNDMCEHFDFISFFPKTGKNNPKIQTTTTTVPLNILQKYLGKKTLVTTMADKWRSTSRSTLRDLFV